MGSLKPALEKLLSLFAGLPLVFIPHLLLFSFLGSQGVHEGAASSRSSVPAAASAPWPHRPPPAYSSITSASRPMA